MPNNGFKKKKAAARSAKLDWKILAAIAAFCLYAAPGIIGSMRAKQAVPAMQVDGGTSEFSNFTVEHGADTTGIRVEGSNAKFHDFTDRVLPSPK